MELTIYFDSIQEGEWFRTLHPHLRNANLEPFPSTRQLPPYLAGVLALDRPDIVLVDSGRPILVLERTIEVPSGHNVGQRFARLVAAARERVPVVYFGPYAAYKHGGQTQGPRYMNLRLFQALAKLSEVEQSAVTTIRWPVDADYEIVQSAAKDRRVIEYLNHFFDLYSSNSTVDLSTAIMQSDFERQQEDERDEFIRTSVRRAAQYNGPPNTVRLCDSSALLSQFGLKDIAFANGAIVYKVGMTYIRSDPYTGMGLLYSYLYCNGLDNRTKAFLFHFPHITTAQWQTAASGRTRKDVRLFTLTADAIVFSDGIRLKADL